MVMARVAAEPQNSRETEAEVDALARGRASVVSAARKTEKMAPRVPLHVSGGCTKMSDWNGTRIVMRANHRLVL